MSFTEFDVIQAIQRIFPTRPEITPLGIGDDCALLARPGNLITTDASVEDIHYDLSYVSLAEAAYRCLASNLSDIAAMGGYATSWTLVLGLKPGFEFAEIERSIQALRQCLEDHQLPDAWLVGGDVVCAYKSFFSITVLGQCQIDIHHWAPIKRSGAKPGDAVAVFGFPGRAAAGLDQLMRFGKNNIVDPATVQAFLNPHALTQLGPALAQNELVSAMMDTSDGIYTDLPRLLAQSNAGAIIDVETFNPDEPLQRQARALQTSPLKYQLCGGEDYGLIATVPNRNIDTVRKLAYSMGIPVAFIGTITDNHDLVWTRQGQAFTPKDQSFRHFS